MNNCSFCANIDFNKYNWTVRSKFADDNLCEIIAGNNCVDCYGCADNNENFILSLVKINDCTYINISYIKYIKELKVMPFSENIQINFCPFCGKQISKDIVKFEDNVYLKVDVL